MLFAWAFLPSSWWLSLLNRFLPFSVNLRAAHDQPALERRPQGSTWGDFGPDDQLGRLNLITPEKVRQGVAEVREGLTFCLSLPLDYPGGNVLNPRRHPPVLRPTLRNGRPNMNYPPRPRTTPTRTDVICDDAVDPAPAVLDAVGQPRARRPAVRRRRRRRAGGGATTTAFAPASDIVGPSDAADAGAPATCPARSTSRGARRSASRTWRRTACRAAA